MMDAKLELKGTLSLEALSKQLDAIAKNLERSVNQKYEYKTVRAEASAIDITIQTLHENHPGWEYLNAIPSHQQPPGPGPGSHGMSIVLRKPI